MKFRAGDFSLDDALWLGSPVVVDSDQTETLIENNQCYTMQEIPHLLKIPQSIKLLVKMKTVSYGKKLNGLFEQPNMYVYTYLFIYLILNRGLFFIAFRERGRMRGRERKKH